MLVPRSGGHSAIPCQARPAPGAHSSRNRARRGVYLRIYDDNIRLYARLKVSDLSGEQPSGMSRTAQTRHDTDFQRIRHIHDSEPVYGILRHPGKVRHTLEYLIQGSLLRLASHRNHCPPPYRCAGHRTQQPLRSARVR